MVPIVGSGVGDGGIISIVVDGGVGVLFVGVGGSFRDADGQFSPVEFGCDLVCARVAVGSTSEFRHANQSALAMQACLLKRCVVFGNTSLK